MVSTLRHRGARSAIDLSLRIIVLVCVVATPSLGQEPPPELAVDPQQIDVRTGALRWTGLRLTNSDDGELTWNARVDKPWLKLAAAEARVPVDGLAGVGEILLQVRTIGRGLERGSYEGHVVIDGPDGAVTVPVTMIVGVEPTLDPSETRIESAAVPTGAWSTPFAVSVEEVLTRPFEEIIDQLRQQSGSDLLDTRVVAVTAQRVLYVAAESEWNSTIETRVWISADGGATWTLLLHRQPNIDCQYTNRLQSAALHPDGERVFLGVTDGLFLNDRKITGGPVSPTSTRFMFRPTAAICASQRNLCPAHASGRAPPATPPSTGVSSATRASRSGTEAAAPSSPFWPLSPTWGAIHKTPTSSTCGQHPARCSARS
jgi:hypothetical protein